MNSTMAIISASSAASSAASARKARESECKIVIKTYDTKTATTEDMREYVRCVDMMYPNGLEPATILVFKISFIVCFLAGIFSSTIKPKYDLLDRIQGFIVGFSFAAISLVSIALLIAAFVWVFTG